MPSPYNTLIRGLLAKHGFLGVDAAAVEEFMRLGHGTLDALSHRDFELEVITSAECVLAEPEMAKALVAQNAPRGWTEVEA